MSIAFDSNRGIIMTRNVKVLGPLCTAAFLHLGTAAVAQTSPAGPAPVTKSGQEPLSDINCNGENFGPATPYPGSTFSNAPRCAVNGTRTITTLDQTRTATTLTGDYRVNFAGTLTVDGVPIAAPGSFVQLDAGNYFPPATVTLASQYTGSYTNVPLSALPKSGNPNDFAYFSRYSDFANDVQSIAFSSGGIATDATGKHQYTYTLAAADPTAITGGNSTALTGNYKQNDGTAIVYGKITGAATLLSAPPPSTATPPTSTPNAYASPYALQYQTSARETTRLDENGLTTPTISVSGGISMNGSKVAGLADGTDPADAVNKRQLDAEVGTRAAADTQLAAGIASEATTRAAQIDAEAGTRAAADTQLAAGIASEATTRAVQIDAEAGTRAAADTQLAAGIASEATTRAAQIDAEAGTRAAADTQLAGGIATEAVTRASQINAEASARQIGDTALNQMIADEATIRAGADARLSQRVDASEKVDNALAQGLASESAARIAADTALSARIDAVGTRLDQVDSRLSRLDRKVSSSTAVAVALGGGTFLPDLRYNLTANVATYDGAQAAAVQFGAMVGPKMAVNAGVATGFNKGGKTAARAGFTIGW